MSENPNRLDAPAAVQHPVLPSTLDLQWQRHLALAVRDGPMLVVEAWLQSGVVPDENTVSAALQRADPLPALDTILAAAPQLVPSTLVRSSVMGNDPVLDLVLQHTSPELLNERGNSPFPIWLHAFAKTPDYDLRSEVYNESMAMRIPTVLAKLEHGGAAIDAMRESPYVREAQTLHGQVLRQAMGIEPSLALKDLVTGVQVVPIIDDEKHVEAQFEGPDHRTTAWGVYVRDRERHANHVQDFEKQDVAERFGAQLARAYAVKVEPYPWQRLALDAKPEADDGTPTLRMRDDGSMRALMRHTMSM
ncbi:hypothetical protein [Burkholderia vietnamiensis]|uniref:hypothetical protein n=1 Tax=Burkholderia vietnamiensis TaxID=60552 RepID=UPI001CF33F02|nr:hypothetical protein [Burkholderia vietnamiensis]MCA8448842.1 hypothetical protein [Burkholderia vietnamiensis]